MGKKALEAVIALARRKAIHSVLRVSVILPAARTPCRLPSNRVFTPHDTQTQFVMFVPVEYLTYEPCRAFDLLREDGAKEEACRFLGCTKKRGLKEK